nr:inactive leucine-rich repeat receptor-like protein kinase CORYNE [Tanacetum cinerariifolium]
MCIIFIFKFKLKLKLVLLISYFCLCFVQCDGEPISPLASNLLLSILLGTITGLLCALISAYLIRCIFRYIRTTPILTGPVVFSPHISPKSLESSLSNDNDNDNHLQLLGGTYYLILNASLALKKLPPFQIHKHKKTAKRRVQKDLEILASLKHRHLMSLKAYVHHPPNRFCLVYDYVPTGSLEDAMKKMKENELHLGWDARLRIAVGIIKGLQYLHFTCTPSILHYNLKPSNVLLDADFEPSLTDSGYYYAPECFPNFSIYTEKSDIFSFGVILGILLTGKDPSDAIFRGSGSGSGSNSRSDIGMWFRQIVEAGDGRDALDKSLLGEEMEEDEILLSGILWNVGEGLGSLWKRMEDLEAFSIETEKNVASGSMVIDENKGRDDTRQQPKKKCTSKHVVASLDQKVKGVETSMAGLKTQVEGLEVLASGGGNTDHGPKIDVPKPSKFMGKWEARTVDDFLWEMEQYLEGVNVMDDASKIKMTTRYLKDTAALWWRRQYGDIERGFESLEASIVVHQKNEAVYEEDIALLKLDVQVRNISIKELKNQLESTLKEKDDLKLKLENFETSSNNLAKLIGSQLDANNKTGLGYGNHVNGCKANDSKSVSDEEDSLVNDRFQKSNGNHALPSPYTGNYMPPRADLSFAGLNDSVYKCKVTESISNESKVETNVTKSCTHSIEIPKTDRPSAPIIEEWESDSDNDITINPISDQPKHTPIKINFVKPIKCVECGENEKQAEKPTSFTQNPKGTGQRETRPVWDDTTRVNHQNKLTHPHHKRNFVSAAILTKSGKVPVNAAKQSSHKAAASVSAARRVNTVAPRPNVNSARPKTTQYLVIIKLTQRVKRLERELKARTPPTKIQKKECLGIGFAVGKMGQNGDDDIIITCLPYEPSLSDTIKVDGLLQIVSLSCS